MWAYYTPSGDIIFGTIAWTKEQSDKLFKVYFQLSPALKSCYECKTIAVDIMPVDNPIKETA